MPRGTLQFITEGYDGKRGGVPGYNSPLMGPGVNQVSPGSAYDIEYHLVSGRISVDTVYGLASSGIAMGGGLGAGSGPSVPVITTTTGGTKTDLAVAACQLISDPVARAFCEAAARGIGGTGTGGITTFNPNIACLPGYTRNGAGMCVKDGIGGAIERLIPGGQTGTQNDIYGDATYGRYGLAMVPGQQQVARFKCPPGMKLGKDELCYDHIHNTDRKWPHTKPLLSAGDGSTLRKAHSIEKRLQRHSMKYLSAPIPHRSKTAKRGKK